MTEYAIQTDGKTVWVHSSDGHTVARFGRNGIDVHTADSTACLDCTHEPTDAAAWRRFQRSVYRHYGLSVGGEHRPGYITGPHRIQRLRSAGSHLPEGARVVDRTTRWGNRYKVERQLVVERGSDGIPIRDSLGERGPWTVKEYNGKYPTGREWGGFGGDKLAATEFAVDLYRRMLLSKLEGVDGPLRRRDLIDDLAGRDLACWCPIGAPCHGDVLLDIANPPT